MGIEAISIFKSLLTVLIMSSGWLAFFLSLLRHRRNRPLLKFDDLNCLKKVEDNYLYLLTQATIRNDGDTPAFNCSVDFLVCNGDSLRVVDKGKGSWMSKLHKIKSSKLDYVNIDPFGRDELLVKFLIYPTTIPSNNPSLLKIFPSSSDSSSFIIIIVITFGNCQKEFDFIQIRLLKKIEIDIIEEEAYKCLDIIKKRSPILRQKLRTVVKNHNTYMEELYRQGFKRI